MDKRGSYKFIKALDTIGPAPCENCNNRALCATGRACDVFRLWCSDGTIDEDLGRIPVRTIYDKLFSGRPA